MTYWFFKKPKDMAKGSEEVTELLSDSVLPTLESARQYAKKYGYMWILELEKVDEHRNREKADEFEEKRGIDIVDHENDF
jgi:hypothetical protein